jgi:hypothetical protein
VLDDLAINIGPALTECVGAGRRFHSCAVCRACVFVDDPEHIHREGTRLVAGLGKYAETCVN